MKRFDLDKHLAKEHKKLHVARYLPEVVYGGNDGIVTTFAVVAGFAGAQKDMGGMLPVLSVLLFGLANLFADGLSMALGSFLSLRADQDMYANEKAKEAREIAQHPEDEIQETIEILRRKNFSHQDAKALATIYSKNPEYWTEFMMKDELDIPSPEGKHAFSTAFFTFIAFVIFGFIPLVPYVVRWSDNAFVASIGFSATAMFLLGLLRTVVTRKHPLLSIVETLGIGSLAASVAYFVGTLF